ncbi:hypothetical protein EHM82_03105 [bacterium]|nr:MAG: hypothetical protein EHM82_03105 [bacterium]
MKKKIGMFLFAVALASFAFVSGPVPDAEAAPCLKPECLVSPGCCHARECADWCAMNGGGAPGCSGGGQGGCCFCGPVES